MQNFIFILFFSVFLLFSSTTFVLGIRVSENEIVAEIEENISQLIEKTKKSRSVSSERGVERIMLRMAGTGFLALSRNEIFAESQTIFQEDDLEEEVPGDVDASSRSQYVPTVGLGEKLFTVPSSFLLQSLGRALLQAGFISSDVFKLKSRTLPCNVDNWRSDYQQYRASYHPAVGAALAAGSLKYRLSQFLRRAKTDLSCLDGDIQNKLDSFKVVVSDDIDRTARGVLNVRDDDINTAVLDAYDAIETVRVERRRDWNTVLMLRWVTLISKLSGHTLLVLGRNIGEWPADVDLLNDVSVSYYAGLLGRAVYNVLFVLSDFRDINDYKKPDCGSTDLHEVLCKQEFSPLLSGAPLEGVEKELLLIEFSSQLKESVSCLTEVPKQFFDLDTLGTKKAAKSLKDSLEDIVDAIKS